MKHSNKHNLTVRIPSCDYINESDEALALISKSITVLIESVETSERSDEERNALSSELGRWLTKVYDPKATCNACRSENSGREAD